MRLDIDYVFLSRIVPFLDNSRVTSPSNFESFGRMVTMSDLEKAADRLNLPGGFQLFAEPEREWLALAQRGTIDPINLTARALRLLAGPMEAADSRDIVLTIDTVGVDWEAHVELTKAGVSGESLEDQARAVLGTMPNRFDEYLSTTFNITDVATLFASATHRFGDAHALVSVPFREVKQWIEIGAAGSTTQEQVRTLVEVLARMLGGVDQSGGIPHRQAIEWHSRYDHVANQLIGAISLRG